MFEQEAEYSQVVSWDLPESSQVDVLASDEESVTISFEAEVEAEFGAHFSFSVRDSIDRNYVSMGSASQSAIETFRVPIVVTLPKGEDDDPEPFDVEVEGRSLVVDFGYVEPDWGCDE